MYCFSLLVNANDIEVAITHLKHIYTLFGSKYISNDVNTSFRYLENQIKRIGNNELQKQVDGYQENSTEHETDEDDDDKDESDEEESIKAVSKKPFLPYVLKRLEKCQMTCNDETLPVNDNFQPCFREMLENKWIGMIPFWSGIMLGMQMYYYQSNMHAYHLP